MFSKVVCRRALYMCSTFMCTNSVAQSASPQVWPDFAVKREIANLKVKCDNYQGGCDWAGLFKDLMVQCV